MISNLMRLVFTVTALGGRNMAELDSLFASVMFRRKDM